MASCLITFAVFPILTVIFSRGVDIWTFLARRTHCTFSLSSHGVGPCRREIIFNTNPNTQFINIACLEAAIGLSLFEIPVSPFFFLFFPLSLALIKSAGPTWLTSNRGVTVRKGTGKSCGTFCTLCGVPCGNTDVFLHCLVLQSKRKRRKFIN